MSNENLQLTAVADVTQLVKGLKIGEDGILKFEKSVVDLERQLKSFKEGLKIATSAESVGRLNRAIEVTESRIGSIKNAGKSTYDNFSKGANQAAQATVNLGRVAQDLPFGFIGIQNNLNPLVESFQRLKVETGSTGGALKALAGSLIGPAGIGLALSAVSAAFLIYQNGIAGFKRNTNEAGASTKEFAKELNQAEASALTAGIKLREYVDIARDNTKSLEQRNYALSEANKIMGEHGTKLTLLNIGTKEVTDAVNLYTEAVIANAVANKYAEKVASLVIQKNEAYKSYAKSLQKVAVLEKDINSQQQGRAAEGNYAILQSAIKSANKEKQNYIDSEKTLKEAALDANTAISKSTELFGKLGTKDKTKATVKVDKEKSKKIIEKDLDDIFSQLRDLRFPIKVDMYQQLKDAEKTEDPLSGVSRYLDEKIRAYKPKPFRIPLIPQAKLVEETFDVKTFAENTVASFGEGISKALQGVGNPFSGLLELFGSALQDLGKKFIAASTLIQAIKEKIKIGSKLAIPLGLGLIVLGGLIKSAANQNVKGFATGVQNFQGGVAMVGERGPELVNLPRGADVIPNYQLAQSSIGGGQSLEVTGEFVLRNDSLVMAVRRGTNTMLKTG